MMQQEALPDFSADGPALSAIMGPARPAEARAIAAAGAAGSMQQSSNGKLGNDLRQE